MSNYNTSPKARAAYRASLANVMPDRNTGPAPLPAGLQDSITNHAANLTSQLSGGQTPSGPVRQSPGVYEMPDGSTYLPPGGIPPANAIPTEYFQDDPLNKIARWAAQRKITPL